VIYIYIYIELGFESSLPVLFDGKLIKPLGEEPHNFSLEIKFMNMFINNIHYTSSFIFPAIRKKKKKRELIACVMSMIMMRVLCLTK
jgi:hypothetical protein